MKTPFFLTVVILLFAATSQARQPVTADDFKNIEYDARLTGVSYPFDVRTFRFSSQGQDLEMAYMYLPAEKGFPVVTLLHGKNFNGSYWENTAKWLHDQGYGVLMPDQIGFGKSSKPTDYQYSFAALASNTKALMDKLNILKTIVVGHSMGGMLATRFALLYDDTATRLVLVNPIGLENYLVYEHYRDVNSFYRSELKKSPQDIISYQQKRYYDGQWNSDYASFAEPLIGWIQGPDWPILAKVSALTYDMIFTQPVIEDMQYLQIPVSLILGTRDRTAPGADQQKADSNRELGRYDKLGQQVKVRNDKIRITELNGLGHLPQIEDFDRFKAPFLEAIARRPGGNDEPVGSDSNE